MHILHYFLTTNTFCRSIHHLTLATLPPYNTVITYHNINPLISILTLRGTLHYWYCQNRKLAAKFQRNSILKSVKYSRTFMQVTFYKDILQHKLTIQTAFFNGRVWVVVAGTFIIFRNWGRTWFGRLELIWYYPGNKQSRSKASGKIF